MIWLPPLPNPGLYAQPRAYDYPSYDAPRTPDMRLPITLPPVYDFRQQRMMHDLAPQPQAPARLGMTLNSLPPDVLARMMGAYSG